MRFSKNGHKNRLFSMSAAIAMIVLFTASCQAKSGQSEDPDKPNPQLKTVTLRSGDVQVIAEVALTELERNRGLMFRKNLADGKGVLFVFDPSLSGISGFRWHDSPDPGPRAVLAGSAPFRAERPLRPRSSPRLVRQGRPRSGGQVRNSSAHVKSARRCKGAIRPDGSANSAGAALTPRVKVPIL